MLSICIITKNEEKNIARCLQCLSPYDFEIIVVDTGSSDRTREIAKQYTKNVYEFTWCDDFAAAKEKHRSMGCIQMEIPEAGIYFISDPDKHLIEILPADHPAARK